MTSIEVVYINPKLSFVFRQNGKSINNFWCHYFASICVQANEKIIIITYKFKTQIIVNSRVKNDRPSQYITFEVIYLDEWDLKMLLSK